MRRTQSVLVARSSLAHSLALCLDKKTHAETRNIMKRKARSGKGFHRRIHAYRVLNCTRMRGGGNRVMCKPWCLSFAQMMKMSQEGRQLCNEIHRFIGMFTAS